MPGNKLETSGQGKPLNVPRLIERKRNGQSLTAEEWAALIGAYVDDRVPDYQMSALAMAIVFQGLAPDELVALTRAMLESGDRFDLAGWPAPRVDKHSIGGVGDKTSLLLAPMLAELGVAVPMISGRGPGPHRRHARQAGVDPRFPDRPLASGGPGPAGADRRGDAGPDARAGARRPEALRPS